MKRVTDPNPTLLGYKAKPITTSRLKRWLQRWFGGLAVVFAVTAATALPVANKPLIGNGTAGANNVATIKCIAKQQVVNLTVTVNGVLNTSYQANWTDLNTFTQGSGSTFTVTVGDMVGVTVGWQTKLPPGSTVKLALM